MEDLTLNQNSHSTSETGHAKNLANFNMIILYCEGIAAYNPPNGAISMVRLRNLFDETTAAFGQVDGALTAFSNVVDARQLAYEGLRKLSTRILGSLIASGADKSRVDELRMVNNKIQGRPPRTRTNESAVFQEAREPVSNSQQSYDSLANFFRQMVEILRQPAEYGPNEEDLRMVSLETFGSSLYTLNNDVATARVKYLNYLKERNALLYVNEDSVYERCKLVKGYVRSLLGTSDPLYREVNGIKVTNLNR